jgi:hypothetical protein
LVLSFCFFCFSSVEAPHSDFHIFSNYSSVSIVNMMYIPFVVMFLYSLINQMLLIEAKDKDNVSFGFIS